MPAQHQHAEAFMLMRYRADNDPSDEEIVWNSRDGVTPFVITLPSGHTATHIAWDADVYAPPHRHRVGERVFTDFTEQAAQQLARTVARESFGDEGERGRAAREAYPSEEDMAQALAGHYLDEASRGAPDLVVVTQEMARERGWL